MCPLHSLIHSYLFKVTMKVCSSAHQCNSICHLILVLTIGVHLLFWLSGLPLCSPACIQLLRTDARRAVVNPLICLVYTTNALIWCRVPSSMAWHHSVIQRIKGGEVSCVNWSLTCVCVCVCLPRYIPFEGRTGANTVLTSCGASLHRESAAQVLYALQHKMLHVVDCLKISCPVSRITRGIIRSASSHGCFSYLAWWWWWWCYVFSLLHLGQTRWHRPVADSSKDI